ncbi:MalY/PatB family protein [Heyndrickxia vini]|uniref:cysteine-S-conjugate beta-lyase n=1 Tax=Heyndrickxia vini TaxID=1476025 RepID=A0ABX7E222_9BACI|nr:MalY/PatB family protein [Heyndrickxia vini]QQZ09281.1 pyridoxal phosphate-dependent aminotransferase [Heyndrickxia vini]
MNWNDCIVRTHTHSVKWSTAPDEIIPMCIADMDFQVAPEIIEAMKKKAEHGIYGYTTFCDRYYRSIIGWWKRRFNIDIDKEWISFSPGIIPGINLLLEILTKPGDQVIAQEPVYYPFYSSIENHQCTIVHNSLIHKNGTYEMDFVDLEKKASHPKAKVLILCSPHNPVGRAWTEDELAKVADICLKHNVWIISDEMHGDLVYKGKQHHPLFSIHPEIKQSSILCAAPSKTFNVAGLQTSIIMIPNQELREKYNEKLFQYGLMRPNAFGVEATIAAYESSEYWLEELLIYLEENLEYVLDFFKSNIPEIIPIRPEATHLVWLDCSQLGMQGEELFQYFLKEAKIKFDEGYKFGGGGDAFLRMNIACPKERLETAVHRIHETVLRWRSNG